MPAVSLLVCIHRERALLERLLRESAGVYDDLVVVHDGSETAESTAARPPAIDYAQAPATPLPEGYREPRGPARAGSVRELVVQHGGRFFEGPRSFQQEPHWPFAWSQARHDWILRLDADEFPSSELKAWLRAFREGAEPGAEVSGYTCIWPLWDGSRTVTQAWPAGRQFVFHKQRMRFFGMVEQVPVADGVEEALPLILHHQPARKSYGLGNLLLRRQAYHWRRVIAQSLLGKPTELACWRWTSEDWPRVWEDIRRHPLRQAFYRLLLWPFFDIRNLWRKKGEVMLSAVLCAPVHHFLICLNYWWYRRRSRARSKA